jgi:hypothetical protein
MAEAPSSTSTLIAFFNFNPHRQLHPSSPISTLVAFNFNPYCLSIQTPSLFYFLPFSLMAAVCLMQLLPDDLVTQIIIYSIKDEPTFYFLNLHNKICGTIRCICDSNEVLLHVSLRHLRQVCFEWCFREANHPEALCFEGIKRLMRWWNPNKGLKLIDHAATEDSGAKYFLVMLKYRCNPVDPESMALHQEISSGPLPPDGRWKNHNLWRLCYLINQDLDNIAWWYWLDDGEDDIPLLPVQNPHICIWAAGCRRYEPDTKEIIH